MIYTYKVFGLIVASEIPLPELNRVRKGPTCDVAIAVGPIPHVQGEREDGLTVTEAGALLNVPGTGRYLIRAGREIRVEKDRAGTDRHLRLFLLGSAFGAILHQRNLLPLHANAIEVGQHAIAFMGVSGAGKSTMAAWFHDRGQAVLSDDVCAITFKDDRPIAQPGIPRLRLWRDALEGSGRTAEAYDLAFDDADKYNVPTRSGSPLFPLPLGAVYLLDAASAAVLKPEIRPLKGVEALEALVANTYRGAYVPMLGATRQHLSACMAVASQVPVFAVRRVWGRECMDGQLQALERHAVAAVESHSSFAKVNVSVPLR